MSHEDEVMVFAVVDRVEDRPEGAPVLVLPDVPDRWKLKLRRALRSMAKTRRGTIVAFANLGDAARQCAEAIKQAERVMVQAQQKAFEDERVKALMARLEEPQEDDYPIACIAHQRHWGKARKRMPGFMKRPRGGGRGSR
jgi:hypothetical protein